MKLADKIDQIRQKPEHIRMRYVWACTGVSMFFIIVLWVFSMTGGRVPRNNPQTNFSGSEVIQQFQNQKQSMEEYKSQLNEMQNSLEDMQNQETGQEEIAPETNEQNLNSEISPNLINNSAENNLGN